MFPITTRGRLFWKAAVVSREKESERHTYIHTYIHTHTHTHKNTHTHSEREKEREREREGGGEEKRVWEESMCVLERHRYADMQIDREIDSVGCWCWCLFCCFPFKIQLQCDRLATRPNVIVSTCMEEVHCRESHSSKNECFNNVFAWRGAVPA